MARKMTERAAWLYLAGAWETAAETAGEFCPRALGHDGLCFCINKMQAERNISWQIAASMREKINALSCIGDDTESSKYCWRLDVTGAKQRAAFCRKQAANLTKKKAKVKK